MTNHIGGKINKLSYKIKRKVCSLPSIKVINEISGTNSVLLGFISRNINEGKDVYQKDIEKEFGITRSTASKVITLMEKKELVIRVGVEGDARLKKLVLTEKAEELNAKAREEINNYDSKLLKGFSEKETNLLFDFLARINKNLEEIE
jgi:DNA-binding MarR family transcriptional regulator